jgi:hypothetical protein
MTIKPGDLFEWVYAREPRERAIKIEELYSNTMGKWIPCSGLCLCIGVSRINIHWTSDKGLFHAHIDKAAPLYFSRWRSQVIMQRIEL